MLFLSCVGPDVVLVFLEPPFWASVDGSSLADRLTPVGKQLGRRFEVRRARSYDAPLRELEELLNERVYRSVVVGPLMTMEVGQIALLFKAVQFVALGLEDARVVPAGVVRSPTALPSNVTELRFARRDGFRHAGQLVAALEPVGTIGVISVRGSGETVINAFKEGYADGGGRATIDHRWLLSTRDQGEIRRLIEDFARKDIGTVLLRAGPLTADGLQVMRGQGMRAIVSNFAFSGGDQIGSLDHTVLCSIDDDLTGALLEIFRSQESGSTDSAMVGSTVVRCGGAAAHRDDVASYVDRRAGS